MIAKLVSTLSNVQQNIEQLQTPTMGITINNTSTTAEPPWFCCCWKTINVQLAWRPSNYCNASSRRRLFMRRYIWVSTICHSTCIFLPCPESKGVCAFNISLHTRKSSGFISTTYFRNMHPDHDHHADETRTHSMARNQKSPRSWGNVTSLILG